MRQPQNGRPGVLGDHHGLTRLTHALAALEAGQRTQEARDTAIRAQLTTQAQELVRLRAGSHRLVLAIAGLGVLVLALGGAVGWQLTHPPEQGYARALGAIDATLGQQWGTLPKAVQEALRATYGRGGMVSPGDRQGARQ